MERIALHMTLDPQVIHKGGKSSHPTVLARIGPQVFKEDPLRSNSQNPRGVRIWMESI